MAAVKKKPLALLSLVLLIAFQLQSQIPHGLSRPLAMGAEKASKMRSNVDYFVEMPSLDTDSAKYVDDLPGNRIGGLRFAHTFYTNLSPENAGIVFHAEDGSRIWKLGIRSNGAFSLNVLFSSFDLPEGATVFLYNPDRSVILGPFTRENKPNGGEFSVAPVEGDELIVEYKVPSTALSTGKICITEINHDFRGLFRYSTRFHSLNMPCLPDVTCNSTLETISRSVCLLIINGNTYCTGTLLNNTANNGKPYLITASHCLENNPDASSRVIAFFNYRSPHCDSRIRGSEEFSMSGSTCRALSAEIDFALIELEETPPSYFRPWLAGWSIRKESLNDAPFTCIHHPNGDIQKYCTEEDSMTHADLPYSNEAKLVQPGNHWNIRQWEIGHTWGGSSGSGIFDKQMRFRGGLSGGDSGGLLGCGSYNNGDYFFRFDKAWNHFSAPSKQLKHWLDPITPDSVSSVTTLDGLDPYAESPASRITNIQKTDSLGKPFIKDGWGSPFGHNSLLTTNFAEHFTTIDSSMVLGTYLMVGKGINVSSNPIYVLVYEGGKTPGTILGRVLLNPNYLDYVNDEFVTKPKNYFSNKENFVRFNKPVSVGKDFYIGYELFYPLSSASDTFNVYGAIRNDHLNTAFFTQKKNWYPYSFHPTNPMNTSLWIEPVIARDTTSGRRDTIIMTTALRPIVAWSNEESKLSIAFPNQWTEPTLTEVMDLSGKCILKTTLSPPIDYLYFGNKSPRLLLIRLSNGKLVSTQKALIGFE